MLKSNMLKELNDLKKKVFYEMLDLGGRVFILVRYSEDVLIGKRGFTEEEKKNGIILVFNKKMAFSWDDSGISATLIFGTTPEKCFIPSENILVIFSPELRSQFIVTPDSTEDKSDERVTEGSLENLQDRPIKEEKVIKVDFSRKKKSH